MTRPPRQPKQELAMQELAMQELALRREDLP